MSEGRGIVVTISILIYVVGWLWRGAVLNGGRGYPMGPSCARAVWWPLDLVIAIVKAFVDICKGRPSR